MADDKELPVKHGLMSLNQVIAMLMAAQSQGAKHVMIIDKPAAGYPEQTGVEWVGMAPVGDTVYMVTEQGGWSQDVSNAALESLDL